MHLGAEVPAQGEAEAPEPIRATEDLLGCEAWPRGLLSVSSEAAIYTYHPKADVCLSTRMWSSREPGRHSGSAPKATSDSRLVTELVRRRRPALPGSHLGWGHHSRGWYLEQQRRGPVVARQQNRPARPRGSSQITDSEHHEHIQAPRMGPAKPRPRHLAAGAPHVRASLPASCLRSF